MFDREFFFDFSCSNRTYDNPSFLYVIAPLLTTLADSINFLAGSIDLNSEKLEAIDDDLKSIKGVVHCPCQSDCGKTQQQNREEQSDTDSFQPSNSLG